ncbi:LuxR family transcriptional regulator, partial [Nocardia concava]|uniref:LuxR family transcriptional regulator n=1 Tax=Nocardia concava TaxID=257281 RepID=UPI000592FBF7
MPEFGFTPIARPELYVRLDGAVAAPGGQVVAISAPVGTGKTVLVADWVERHLRRIHPDAEIGWLTVADTAIAHCEPHTALPACFGAELSAAGRPEPVADTEAAVAQLVSWLAARNHPIVLVIDNAHLISESSAIRYLECFLLSAPSNTTVVLAARHDLPLRWHALDLAGRLTRLRARDLAFTGLRAGQLTRRHGCALSEAELTIVGRLTRGWAALVRLAAVHVSTHPDRAAALAGLAEVPQPIADFLTDEVLAPLPEPLYRLVTALSVPSSFTRSLATRLTGARSPHPIDDLARLEFPLDVEERRGEVWYTLHPMLRFHLLDRLRRTGIGRTETLDHDTADWYLSAGLPLEALPHLVRAPDSELLARFLRENAVRLVLDGHGRVLFEQLERSRSATPNDPFPWVLNDPFLWALRVLDALEREDAGKAIVCLDLLYRQPHRTGRIVPAGWIAPLTVAASAGIARATGLGLSEFHSPAPLPECGCPEIDAYSTGELGMALLARGAYEQAESLLRRSAALADCSGIARLRVRAATRLAIMAGIRDEPGPMRGQAGLAVDLARRHGLAGSPDGRRASAAAALSAYVRGAGADDPVIADFLATERVPAPPNGLTRGRITEVIAQLLAFDGSEDKYTAAESLRRGAVVLLRGPSSLPAVTGWLLPHVVRVLLDVQAANSARLLTDQAEAALGRGSEVVLADALTVLATRPQAAHGLVAPLLRDVEAARPLESVTAWLVEAVAQDALHRPGTARDALERALLAAAPDQLVRPFLDVPGAGALLDAHVGTLGQHNDFAEHIRAHPQLRRTSARPRLTPAELTVLNQLPSGRTAAQIAGVLGVSVNTVKTHLRGIYAKFG